MNTLTVKLIAVTLTEFLSTSARADVLQVFFGNNYIPYAAVYVNNQRQGYTDMYGRIRISLPNGVYIGRVETYDGSRQLNFKIDDAQQIKKIYST
jgi:hypothetical protein